MAFLEMPLWFRVAIIHPACFILSLPIVGAILTDASSSPDGSGWVLGLAGAWLGAVACLAFDAVAIKKEGCRGTSVVAFAALGVLGVALALFMGVPWILEGSLDKVYDANGLVE